MKSSETGDPMQNKERLRGASDEQIVLVRKKKLESLHFAPTFLATYTN